jgi:5-methylcytosine-specific restriction endonuclease McrBC regulatory subunit McrC
MRDKPIILEDNHESRELSDDEARKLLRFAGCGLRKLCLDNPSLLLFPDCLGDNGDDIDEPLYSIVEKRLWTGNVVGFWGVDGVNVRVHSRFDDDRRQYFFHYMLQRIAGVNVFDLKTLPDPENNIWNFLIYLFPMAVKRAVRQGIFRAYRVFRYDDDRVKGAIDVPQFIRRDIPFAGRVAYTTREHTANNHVLQLVRHTIEFIRRIAPVLLSIDSEMRQAIEMVVQATPDYSERSRSRVIVANLRPVRHPFYSD